MGMFFDWCNSCPICWDKHCEHTEEEKTAYYVVRYNENNFPDSHLTVEHLSKKEVIEKYGDLLTEEQLKNLNSYGDVSTKR